MKKYLLFTIFTLIISTKIILGQKITETVFITPDVIAVEQVKVGTNNPTYDRNTNFNNIGMSSISNTTYIYRTIYKFSLSAINYTPTNHTVIKTVVLDYTTGGIGYTFKITQPNSLPVTDSEIWNTVGNSTTKYTGITYSGSSINPAANLVLPIQSSLSSGYLYLGVASENESINGSNTGIFSFNLTVTYERDKKSINITVQNDLHGSHAGKIYVNSSLLDSPAPKTVYENSTNNFAVFTPQSYTESNITYNYIWHQGSVNTSKWEKNYLMVLLLI